MSNHYFIGFDIGTQGARTVLLDDKGQQIAATEAGFLLNPQSREEQSADEWWAVCHSLLSDLCREAAGLIDLQQVKAVAVTSTSGTIVPIDRDGGPLCPAIMYSDARSEEDALLCKTVATREMDHGYTAFTSSSGLPKMHWFLRRYPEQKQRLHQFIHASDFITGRLCGRYDVTDFTNAMKSGYDLHRQEWPYYLFHALGMRREWLQEVRPSGQPLAPLLPALCEKWGLPLTTMVTTGMTDGCASQVAAGAVAPGQWNSTIGTTLVIKGVTEKELVDPAGIIYNHRHPSGYWMPGGASNTGADWVSRLFAADDLRQLNEAAALLIPTDQLAWPLIQTGERFPFRAPAANGFWPGHVTRPELFAACMEGVAFIERFAYDRIRALSGEKIDAVFSAGGASRSDTWLRIRASVLQLPVMKMKNVSGAAGSAILAASGVFYDNLSDAAARMVLPEKKVDPDPALVSAYQASYQRFLTELRERKILPTA